MLMYDAGVLGTVRATEKTPSSPGASRGTVTASTSPGKLPLTNASFVLAGHTVEPVLRISHCLTIRPGWTTSLSTKVTSRTNEQRRVLGTGVEKTRSPKAFGVEDVEEEVVEEEVVEVVVEVNGAV